MRKLVNRRIVKSITMPHKVIATQDTNLQNENSLIKEESVLVENDIEDSVLIETEIEPFVEEVEQKPVSKKSKKSKDAQKTTDKEENNV